MRILPRHVLPAMLFTVALAATASLPVEIKEYDLPTANARPHDPAVAPDG